MRDESAVWVIEYHEFDGARRQASPQQLIITESDRGSSRRVRSLGDGTRLPVVSPEGHVLSWHGRLDNRTELRTNLGDHGCTSMSDGALVLALCRRDGLSRTLPRLIGDWALWFWEPHARRLSLARDYAGVCPIYYHLTPQGCLWSASLEALLSVVNGPWPLDRRYLAGLFFLGPDPALTPYDGIASVPPAHTVTVEAGHARSDPFWSPPIERRVCYPRDADYEEHFLALFREAVRCRLDTQERVWAFLSGGLDSSSIVCVADDLIASGEAQVRTLHTITHIYDHSPTTGERSFSVEVEGRRGQSSHYFDTSDYPYLQPRPSDAPPLPYLLDGSIALAHAQKDLMERLGGRVLLCGSGGDELLGNSRRGELVLADHLRHGELSAFGRGLRHWSLSLRRPALTLLCQALASVPRRRARPFPAGPPPWLTLDFVSLVRDPNSVTPTVAYRNWPRSLRSVVARTAQGDYQFWCGCDVRYPFLDRRLVEFCLSIPLEQLTRPGETRSLMRRSLGGVVPARILARRSKNHPARPIGVAIDREWERLARLFSRPLLEQYELASAPGLGQALRRARHGAENFLGSLLWAIVLEEWMRQALARRWLRPPAQIWRDHAVSRNEQVRAASTLALGRR
jgi:asparagine synthase (glutamine-hydrolysing)